MAAPARDIPPTEPRSWKQRLPNSLEWTALALFGLSVLILVSLLLDPPNRNLRGVGGGTFVSRQPFLFLGAGVYVLAGLTAFWSAIIFFRNRIHNLALKAFGITLMAVSFSTLLCLCTESRASEVYFGGYVGSLLATSLSGMSPMLSVTLVGMLFLISAVFATDWFFYELIRGEMFADSSVLEDEDALDAVMPREHTQARVTVAVAPPAAPPEIDPRAEAEEEDPAPAPATDGPRIMRRVVPKLDRAEREPELFEDEADEAPEETFAAHTGTGAEAVIAAETEGEPPDHAEDDEAAPTFEAGYRFFMPEGAADDEAEENAAESEDAEDEAPVFMGRIAAYEEEDEEEAESEDGTAVLFEEEDDEAPAGSLDDEEDEILEDDEPESTLDEALEEEIEVVARDAEAEAASGPPVSKNIFEVIATQDTEEEEAEVEAETPAAEITPDTTPDPDDVTEVETTPVSEAELALYESSAPDADEPVEDQEDAFEEPKFEVEAEEPEEEIEPETEDDLAEPAEEEVFQLDLEENAGDESPRMVFPEALEDLPAERLAGAAGSAVEPENEADEEPAEAPLASDLAAAEVVEDDPFADAPVTGTLFEDALPDSARKRRVRPSTARVNRAIDDMMPSLDRMKQKIAELETEEVDPEIEAPTRAFEAGDEASRA